MEGRPGQINFFPIIQVRPPHVERLRLGYFYRSRPVPPERTLTENDFAFTDQTDAAGNARHAGSLGVLAGGRPHTDAIPRFECNRSPEDLISLYLDVEEIVGEERGPALEWEGWDGESWVPVRERDDTRGLALPGMVAIPWPGTPPSANPLLARFGLPLAWIRARRRSDGPPRRSLIRSAYLNAAWACEIRSYDGETVGAGNGEPGQGFRVRNVPVLQGETLEVRELSGARAQVEEPMLREELLRAGVSDADMRVVHDPRTRQPTEVWVRWHIRAACSSPGRASGCMRSSEPAGGSGSAASNGGAVPAGPDNVRLTAYRAGGGLAATWQDGHPHARRRARGAGEQSRAGAGRRRKGDRSRVLGRGPVMRNRRQAITAGDYEELAREAPPPSPSRARFRRCTRAVAPWRAGSRCASSRRAPSLVPRRRSCCASRYDASSQRARRPRSRPHAR